MLRQIVSREILALLAMAKRAKCMTLAAASSSVIAEVRRPRSSETPGAERENQTSQARQLQLKLTPGTVLVLDNWRVLHGRQPFSGRRVLCGAYHNREDFESLLRQLPPA